MNSWTFENSAKRKKNFSWFYSSLQLSFSTSKEKKRGGGEQNKTMYKNPKYHCAYFLQGQQLKTTLNRSGFRLQYQKTHTHKHGGVKFRRNLNGEQEKKKDQPALENNNRQQSLLSQPHWEHQKTQPFPRA